MNKWLQQGIDAAARKDYAEAERCYRKYLEKDPNNVVMLNNLGLAVQNGKKDYAEAERCYRKALELDPNSASAWTNLGLAVTNGKKDYAEAERCYRKALELNPNNTLAKRILESIEPDLQNARVMEDKNLERDRLETLKKIVKVSKSLLLDDLAKALKITRDDLLGKIFDWAAEFGFEVDKNEVVFGGGRKDDFLAQLDKEFATWSATSKKE